MESLGTHLKNQREKRGIRLEEIASITKINLHSLLLLEKGAWDQLPPDPFIRGFILAYAKYVGLDPKAVLEQYRQEVTPHIEALPLASLNESFAPPSPSSYEGKQGANLLENRKGDESSNSEKFLPNGIPARPLAYGMAAFAVFAVVLGLMMVGKRSTSPDPVAIAPAPETAVTAAADPAPNTEVVAAAPVVVPAPAEVAADNQAAERKLANKVEAPPMAPVIPQKPVVNNIAFGVPTTAPITPNKTPSVPHEIVVKGNEKSWMKVVIDDAPPKQFILQKGESVSYQANSKIKVVIGFAPGLEVYHNGELTQGKQYDGTIHYFIFPRNARFPQDAKRAVAAEPVPQPTEDEKVLNGEVEVPATSDSAEPVSQD